MQSPILMLPGFGGSGPDHWQSLWEKSLPCCRRVEQRDWDSPDRVEWLDVLERAISQCDRPPVLIAHSLACALVVHFAVSVSAAIRAALFVSPADVDEICEFYTELASFAPMPLDCLPFPSTVIASSDDMYVLPERAQRFATSWGSRLVMLEGAGHINADSNLGDWSQGRGILDELLTRDTGGEPG